jgi:hypothetical protein
MSEKSSPKFGKCEKIHMASGSIKCIAFLQRNIKSIIIEVYIGLSLDRNADTHTNTVTIRGDWLKKPWAIYIVKWVL